MQNALESLFKTNEHLTFFVDDKSSFNRKDFFKKISLNNLEDKLLQNIYFCDQENASQYFLDFFTCLYKNIPFVALNPMAPESEKSAQKQEVLNDEKRDFDLVIFTSGSTGKPKGVTHSLENLLLAAKSSNEFYGFQENEGYALTLPLFHIGGLIIGLRMLMSGGKVIMCDPKNISSFFNENIQYLSLVSTQLLKICEASDTELSSIKGIILGGARTPLETLKKALAKNLLLSNSYGQSETCAQIMATPFTKDLSLLESVGRAMPYRTITYCDNRVHIKGPGISLRYIGEKKQCDEIIPSDSFEKKGDYFYVTGRVDNVFQSGGENINPEEIENLLLAYEGVEDALVVPTPHPTLDLVSCAHIQCSKAIDNIALREYLKKNLSSYKIPKCFYFSQKQDYLQSGIKKNRKVASSHSLNESSFRQVCYGDPTRPMIVFLHGFMGQKEDFNETMAALWQDFFCVAIDLPGHGESHKYHTKNWDELILNLGHHLNSFKKEFSLYGYSQGGRVAIGLRPHLNSCKKIFIESANAGIEESEKNARLKFEQSFFEGIKDEKDFKNFIQKWYSMPLFGKILSHEKAPKLFEKDFTLLTDWQHSLDYMSLAAQKNYWPQIEGIAKDMYFAAGEEDQKYVELGKRFEKKGARLTIFKGHAHNIHFEAPLKIGLWIRSLNP